jgi:hypothetical protein
MEPAGVDGQGLQMRTTAIMTGVLLADPQGLAAHKDALSREDVALALAVD